MDSNNENGIVEKSLKDLLRKHGIGSIIVLFVIGIPLFLLTFIGLISDYSHGIHSFSEYGMLTIIGFGLIAVGAFTLRKRIRLKKNIYTYLYAAGTSDDPREVAAKFNMEYLETKHYPELESVGIIITENYLLIKASTVDIAPRSSLICISYDGKAKGKSGDQMIFRIYCKSVPGLKRNEMVVRVAGKPTMTAYQAFNQLGVPFMDNSANNDFFAIAQTNYPQFERNCLGKSRTNT